MKTKNMLVPAFFLFLAFSHAGAAKAASPRVCHANDCISVEVVSSMADMERGLMYRDGLVPDHGMLFIFDAEGRRSFWMKNMRFDLDILWLNTEGRIVYIGRHIPACRAEPCPVYTPDQAARYVLEVNSGFSDAHHWKEGDKLDLPLPAGDKSDILKK